MRFGAYLKAAFTNRWNLLTLFGALGFALLSGRFDVFGPLVLAGELGYLGLLGTHPKFQRYVEAQAAKATRDQGTESAEQALQRVMNALPDNLVQRFKTLRSQCLELRQIALALKDPSQARAPATTENPLEEMQLAGLDRLLWIYLRLLFTQDSLERFLQKTSEEQIRRDITKLEVQLKSVPASPEDPQRQKIRKALEDNLETSKTRLANVQKARDNHQLVQLEIDRLENKIRSLSELAINRQEPDFISAQVDQVVTSMVQTERTMNELQFATGLEVAEEAVPELLQRETIQVKQ